MSHPTCCCSASLDRCDRCDLLVGLEGFHLMSVARTPGALVLDVESCNQLAGCPGCGVIAQGHGRMVVEVIDAPWAGIPTRFRWFKRRWICREHACQIATFTEQNHSVCAPRARLGVRAIRWAIRQLRFEGATISGLARQLGTTWNTVWSHIKPCLQAASDDPARFAGVRVLGVDEHVWHHQDRRRRGPREFTGIVDHSRGGSSHSPLVGPGPGKVWHRVQELVGRARRRLPCRGANRDAGSLPGTARTPSTTSSKTPPACSTPSILSSSLATPQVRCVAASSKTPWVTADARVIPSTKSGFFCAPRAAGSPHVKRNASVRPSWQMRRISVSKSPTAAPSKSETSSIKTHPPKADAWPPISSRAYQSVPSPKSLAWGGPYANGRTHSTPTSTPAEPATHRTEAINGHYRTRQTHRQRLPQPHQLPTPNAPHRRRPRRLHPHSTMKSQ